jgi:hypothetical protein
MSNVPDELSRVVHDTKRDTNSSEEPKTKGKWNRKVSGAAGRERKKGSFKRPAWCRNDGSRGRYEAGAYGLETTMTDRPGSRLAVLSLERAIHLRWVLRDIKAKRTRLSPVSLDDLETLIEMGLVEMEDDVPKLTAEGHRALGGTEGEGEKW